MNVRNPPSARILVVDDTVENRKLLSLILGTAGYEVQEANDGVTALQSVEASPPDLILLDVMMPGIDGYEVCRRLKAAESSRHIPVIFVTSLDDVDAETRGFDLGAADFITKPINLPVVLARVRTHVALYAQRRGLEGMFRDVIEFAPDAFVLTDMQGRIVQINARAEKLFGYDRTELMGRAVEVLVPSHLREAHVRLRGGYAENPHGSRDGLGVQCLRKDGSQFPGDVSLSHLQTIQGRLVMAVVRDVSERQLAENELRDSRQRLRELAAQTEATRESERKHIAREVHDELGQVLTALRMDMTLLGMQAGSFSEDASERLQSMKSLVDRAILGVRNVAGNLRPAALDMGLGAAVEWLCEEFTKHTGTPCRIRLDSDPVELDEARAVVVFRIVQESLTNITRYAHAARVDVSMAREDGSLRLEILDDGLGFDPGTTARRKTYGLMGMRERAIALGGMVRIISAPGQGTKVQLSIPIDDEPAKERAP